MSLPSSVQGRRKEPEGGENFQKVTPTATVEAGAAGGKRIELSKQVSN